MKAIRVIWMEWLVSQMWVRYTSEKNSATATFVCLFIIDIMVVHILKLWLSFEQGFESISNEQINERKT